MPAENAVHEFRSSETIFYLETQEKKVTVVNLATVKRGNFETLGNFGFFNSLPLLALLCVCGTCHSFLFMLFKRDLGPS